MSQSFSTTNEPLHETKHQARRVLVTGAAGEIGSYFAEHAHTRYTLRLMVREMDEKAVRLVPYGEVVTGDLSDLEGLKAVSEGVDTVVHMAGEPDPSATWQSLLDANIIGACQDRF